MRLEEFEALQAARRRQTTPEFKAWYAARAGIEGTHAQGVRRCGLRRTRYRGLAKTALGHTCIAAALNLVRVAAWLAETPRSTTRRSAFACLASVFSLGCGPTAGVRQQHLHIGDDRWP